MPQTDRLLESLSERFSNAAAEHPAFNHVAAWSSVPTWPYTLTDLTPPTDSRVRNPCERLGLAQRDWEEIIGRTVRQRSGRHRTGCMNWLRFHGKLWEGQYLEDCPEVAALRDSPLPSSAWIERLADPKNHRVLTAHNSATKAALTVFLRLAREAAGLVELPNRPADDLCAEDPADRWLEAVHERVGRIETSGRGHEVSVLPENVFLASTIAVSRLIEKKQEGPCDDASGDGQPTDQLPPSRMQAGRAWEVATRLYPDLADDLILQRHVARKPQHLGMIAAPAAQRMVEERRHGAVVLRKCYQWLRDNHVVTEEGERYIPPNTYKTFASYVSEYRHWKEPGGFGRKKRKSSATRLLEIRIQREERLPKLKELLDDLFCKWDEGTPGWNRCRDTMVQKFREACHWALQNQPPGGASKPASWVRAW